MIPTGVGTGFNNGLAAGTGAAGEVGNEGGVTEAEFEPGIAGKPALVGILVGAGTGAAGTDVEGDKLPLVSGDGDTGAARVGIFEGKGEVWFNTGVVLFFSHSRYISVSAAV